jgi:ribosomal protein L37AE/L43A
MQNAAAGMGSPQWESLAMSTDTDEPRLCEHCNQTIPQARVKALPGTWLCVTCSEEVGGEFTYTATQENLGKAGSLKLNYGGIGQITKKRKKLDQQS